MNEVSQQRIPVFVISLARAAERRERISRHLQALGIAFTIVDGVDGRALPDERQRELLAPGLQVHAGVIGCYLSHLAAYQAVVDGGFAAALVLEDDARLSPRVLPLLRGDGRDPDVDFAVSFDYCFLDSDDHNDRGPVFYDRDASAVLADGIRAHRLSDGPQTLHAYLISRAGAVKRLQHALPIEKPIDLYDHLPYPIVFRSIVAPKLAWVSEDSLVSMTSERSVAADSIPLAALRRWPAFYRLRDALRLKAWRGRREVAERVEAGQLAAGHRWAPLPSGREVLF